MHLCGKAAARSEERDDVVGEVVRAQLFDSVGDAFNVEIDVQDDSLVLDALGDIREIIAAIDDFCNRTALFAIFFEVFRLIIELPADIIDIIERADAAFVAVLFRDTHAPLVVEMGALFFVELKLKEG